MCGRYFRRSTSSESPRRSTLESSKTCPWRGPLLQHCPCPMQPVTSGCWRDKCLVNTSVWKFIPKQNMTGILSFCVIRNSDEQRTLPRCFFVGVGRQETQRVPFRVSTLPNPLYICQDISSFLKNLDSWKSLRQVEAPLAAASSQRGIRVSGSAPNI